MYRIKWLSPTWKRIHYDHHQDPNHLEVLFGAPDVDAKAVLAEMPVIRQAIIGRGPNVRSQDAHERKLLAVRKQTQNPLAALAEKRGLPNLRNTVDALPVLISKKNTDLMEKYSVLSKREMESRYEIYMERYIKDIAVESRLTLEIAKTTVFPAAVKYQYQLASTALALRQLDKTPCTTMLDEVNALAEASPGFVWRMAGEGENADGALFDDPNLTINMTVWETIDHLSAFAYRNLTHRGVMRRRREWFVELPAYLALWWVKAGSVPGLREGKEKLELIARLGPTVEAFDFRACAFKGSYPALSVPSRHATIRRRFD
jgi:hypothetical protein